VHSPTYNSSRAHSRDAAAEDGRDDDETTYDTHQDGEMMDEDLEAQHHHHVPTKPFLSIGLQTVIAITLHKLPEGFITYSTNHANPSLGFNVFMALFVHNIVEGFTMALPLFMALDSRLKAMAWTSLLGGLSQPLGAGIAVLMFKITKRSDITINEVTYACLFAVTAGIMTSVALQLFVESLSINHNRNMSIVCAFLGMLLLGLSNALVKH
jgi:ZIP family zinc transporter